MNDTEQQFQIYLPGLLKILAESLYSSKRVAVRELIQNAHDSCIRRRVEMDESGYRPRIDIRVDDQTRTLSFQDNGSGLTRQEVSEYLSTIGRSYTGQLGENLQVLSPEKAQQLIGQFGLGFLSSFLIASEVTLTTRSYKENSPTLRWHSTGSVHYQVNPTNEGPVGTRVDLKIKPEAAFVFNDKTLRETIRQYADLLPIPIYLNDGPIPLNTMFAPWETADPKTATQEYTARVFQSPNPLAIIPLHDQVIDLGHDSITVPLSGFLFVPPTSIASVLEYGDLTIFVRKMFICEHQRELLPSWARFVRGVIDCPYLQPTASREDIQQDDTFFQVQQALENQLLTGLKRIAEEEPSTWRKIVHGHTDVIMGWAVRDNEFFDQVADIITLRTSRGPMNLPDYLAVTNGGIYYVTRERGSLQDQLLGESSGIPVIDASYFAVTPFIGKYAHHRAIATVVQLDGESNQFFHPVAPETFAPLLDHFKTRGIRAQIVQFKPPELPAVMIYPKDAEFILETRSALDRDEIPGPFMGQVSDFINKLMAQHEDLSGTLYLNAACDLIQLLAAIDQDKTRQVGLDLIYEVARLFSGRLLDTAQVIDAFRHLSASVKQLVQQD